MLLLTENSVIVCAHKNGRVKNQPSQDFVTIEGQRILVENDPEGRSISGCPNLGPTIKPCGTTLKVKVGYSELLTVNGKPICLDTLNGYTDGTPPGVVTYEVFDVRQNFVSEVK
jgi:hypothetical protein